MNDLSRQSFAQRGRRKSTRRGFTLVELLVVVAIIALLISILLPALNKARDEAKRIVDATQLKQLVTASVTYSVENKGYAPNRGLSDWTQPHYPHLMVIDFAEAWKNFDLNKSLFAPYLNIPLNEISGGKYRRAESELVSCQGRLHDVRNADISGGYDYQYATYQYMVMPKLPATNWLYQRNGVDYQPDLSKFTNIKGGRWPIWGCMTLTTKPTGGIWLAHDAPGGLEPPTGMNAAFFDGSAGWSGLNECEPYMQMSSGGQQWYWPTP